MKGGGGFTAISLAFYLSFKSFQAWCDNSAAGVHERGMMILSNDDVNVGKVRGRMTEEPPGAETPSTGIAPELLGPLQVTSQGKMAALLPAAASLHRKKQGGRSRRSLFV